MDDNWEEPTKEELWSVIARQTDQLAEAERTIAALEVDVRNYEAATKRAATIHEKVVAERDEARRVAVWATKHEAHVGFRNFHSPPQFALAWRPNIVGTDRELEQTASVDCEDDMEAIYAALRRAMGENDGTA